MAEGHADGSLRQGMREGISDEQTFENDAVGGDTGSVEGLAGVDPSSPGGLSAFQPCLLLGARAGVQREGGGQATAVARQFHDGTAGQSAIGQSVTKSWQG